MARITGLEKIQAPWHLRWFYGVMRRMFGRDLTPASAQIAFENFRARLNRVFDVSSDELYSPNDLSSRGEPGIS